MVYFFVNNKNLASNSLSFDTRDSLISFCANLLFSHLVISVLETAINKSKKQKINSQAIALFIKEAYNASITFFFNLINLTYRIICLAFNITGLNKKLPNLPPKTSINLTLILAVSIYLTGGRTFDLYNPIRSILKNYYLSFYTLCSMAFSNIYKSIFTTAIEAFNGYLNKQYIQTDKDKSKKEETKDDLLQHPALPETVKVLIFTVIHIRDKLAFNLTGTNIVPVSSLVLRI